MYVSLAATIMSITCTVFRLYRIYQREWVIAPVTTWLVWLLANLLHGKAALRSEIASINLHCSMLNTCGRVVTRAHDAFPLSAAPTGTYGVRPAAHGVA